MILPLVFISVCNIFSMVDNRFIEKIVHKNNFVFDILVSDRFIFEFYDADCCDVDGRAVRCIYEIPFDGRGLSNPHFMGQHMNFINGVYAVMYNHYVNYMITHDEEVKQIWDIIVGVYNLKIKTTISETMSTLRTIHNPNYVFSFQNMLGDDLIYFPTYENYMKRLFISKINNHKYDVELREYKMIMCTEIPIKYDKFFKRKHIYIEHSYNP